MLNMLSWYFPYINLFPFYFHLSWLFCQYKNYLHFFEKFDVTLNSAIVHHWKMSYKMVPVSLFIHDKCHREDVSFS